MGKYWVNHAKGRRKSRLLWWADKLDFAIGGGKQIPSDGASSRPKKKGGSGDSTAFLETATGSAIMALSDGMGREGSEQRKSFCIELWKSL